MNFEKILQDSSAGILITDADFKIVWANKFEENFYKRSLDDLKGSWVVDCHREKNREKISEFLQKFKSGEMKEFTKTAGLMIITYSSFYLDGEFSGIVRTRIKMPKDKA